MEAAIAAMMQPVKSRQTFSPSNQEVHKKKRSSSGEPSSNSKKSKKSNFVELADDNDGSKMFAKTLSKADFAISGTFCNDKTQEKKGISAEAISIRLCFAAVMDLKLSIALSEKDKGTTISDLSFDRLSNAIRSHKNLTHLMRKCNSLKNAQAKCAVIGSAVAMLKSLAMLDSIYMELLPLAASLRHKEERYLLLPDPAAYVACSIPSSASVFDNGDEKNRLALYLELRKAEAEHLGIPMLIAEVVAAEGLSGMTSDNTMRGCCPVGTPALRAWQDGCRDRVCQQAAFACPDQEALALIKQFCSPNLRLLEKGAGTGYWARLIRRVGVKVVATDKMPPKGALENINKMNEYHGCFPSWTTVQPVSSNDAESSCEVLLLVYPPPSNPMAFNALKNFKGNRFIYVGEFRGDTADLSFEVELYKSWRCVGITRLPCWTNTADYLSCWVRLGTEEGLSRLVSALQSQLSIVPISCGGCGVDLLASTGAPGGEKENKKDKSNKKNKSENDRSIQIQTGVQRAGFWRDRFTRCVYACSKACTTQESTVTALQTELNLRCLGCIDLREHSFEMRWTFIQ